jgi:hypothetical protein
VADEHAELAELAELADRADRAADADRAAADADDVAADADRAAADTDDVAADAERANHAATGRAEDTALTRLTRLTALRRDAAAAYAAISAADTALESLAGQRVAGERVLRGALVRYQAASRALAAHARAKPGRLAQLLTGFRAGRQWLVRQTDLSAAVREATEPLTAARRMVSGVKREFAAQVRARAEAVTALRRLTAECVTVLEEIGLAETVLEETGLEETGLEETGRGAGCGADTPGADRRF